MSSILELVGSFIHSVLGKKVVNCLEEFTLVTDKRGWEKVKRRQFYDRCTVSKEEVFTNLIGYRPLSVHGYAGCSGLVVG